MEVFMRIGLVSNDDGGLGGGIPPLVPEPHGQGKQGRCGQVVLLLLIDSNDRTTKEGKDSYY